jgi:hypothetical protein
MLLETLEYSAREGLSLAIPRLLHHHRDELGYDPNGAFLSRQVHLFVGTAKTLNFRQW